MKMTRWRWSKRHGEKSGKGGRMKLPDHLDICGWEVPVIADENPEQFGEFRSAPAPHIKCHPKLCKMMTAHTLLHESLHAISEMHGLELTECQVRTLEIHVGALLRDNPKLARALMQTE
jgi:hypothetical protein